MLSPLHNRAYQDFWTLLIKFRQTLSKEKEELNQAKITLEFQELSKWFMQNVAPLSNQDFDIAIALRWQAVQTEILREFKLLSTDLLFLATARHRVTQQKKSQNVDEHLTKLISYCQIMFKDYS